MFLKPCHSKVVRAETQETPIRRCASCAYFCIGTTPAAVDTCSVCALNAKRVRARLSGTAGRYFRYAGRTFFRIIIDTNIRFPSRKKFKTSDLFFVTLGNTVTKHYVPFGSDNVRDRVVGVLSCSTGQPQAFYNVVSLNASKRYSIGDRFGYL